MTTKPISVVKYFLIIFIIFLASGIRAQQKSSYSLLWKITGKGLNKPSYLFGTMHLKDPRIFHFSDSVMLALQSCQRFALEVHPDTAIAQMFKLMQSEDTSRNLKRMLTKEQYGKLAKKFKAKNGYELKENTNALSVESLMEHDSDKPTDEATFIDAYLYGIAKTFNKSIYGLEDASTQMDQYFGSGALKEHIQQIIEDDDFEEKRGTAEEEMIKIYSAGDLDKIYKYVLEHEMDDSVIVARNKVMAANMIRYMTDEPLFTAVGAAHLPGPDGVIELLRKQGYTVTRVGAAFTGIANTYHIDYSKMKWPEYRDELAGYALSYPGNPIKNNMYGIENVIYTDLSTGLFYGSYAILRNTTKPGSGAEIYNKYISNIKLNNNQILSRKSIQIKGLPAEEILIKNKSGYLITRMLAADNELYVFYVESKQQARLTGQNITRFFSSYTHFPKFLKAPVAWVDFTHNDGAFAVKMPVQPKELIKDIPSEINEKNVNFKLYMYLAVDSGTARSYIVRYNDYPPGYYLNDKQAMFKQLKEQFAGQGEIIKGPYKIMQDGIEGREFVAILKDGSVANVRSFVKGNRIYVLLSTHQSDDSDEGAIAFLNSFKFLPNTEPDYYNFRPDSYRYHLKMTGQPHLATQDKSDNYTSYLYNVKTWYSTDPRSGGSYGFEHSVISPYFRIKDNDSLFRRLIKLVSGNADSVIKIDTVNVSGIKGREIIVQSPDSVKRRWAVFINNHDVFWFISHLDNSQLYNKTSNAFYSSLVIDNEDAQKADLASSKIDKILSGIESNDTLTYKKALGALSFYTLDKSELPQVYAALQKDYKDDTLETGTRHKLLVSLLETNNDSTVSVLTKLYAKIHGKDNIQAEVLKAIYTIDKKNGYDIYFNLLKSDPPLQATNVYSVFNPLIDSAAFSAQHFTDILPFVNADNFRRQLLRVARNMAELDNVEYNKLLMDNYPAIMTHMGQDIDKYVSNRDSNNTSGFILYHYFQLMSKVKNNAINDKLTKEYLLKDPHGLYEPDAIIARINNRLPVNQITLNKYLDSLGTRYDVMDALNNTSQLVRVPPKYKTVPQFAKVCFYQYIATDNNDDKASNIRLLGTVLRNKQVYYAFKFNNNDGTDELFGLAGPYKAGSTKLNFKRYHAYTEFAKLEPDWRKQANKLIPALVDAYK